MRNVIVTGGSRGLGLEISRTLCNAGYQVVAVARGESEPLSAAIREGDPAASGSIQFRPFDLEEIQKIPEFVRGLRKEFGPVYGLVNNAGIGTGGLLSTMQDSAIERLVLLNTVSPIILTKYVVRSMMVDGAGRIVNLGSIVSSTGFKGLSVYAATKASLAGFTRSLAREVGPLGITVNTVAPGLVDTELTDGMTPEDRERVARRSALRRLAEASDVAGAVEYLLGEKAGNVTGATLTVDAGSTA